MAFDRRAAVGIGALATCIVVVGATGSAVAATGGSLILGHTNSAGATTTLTSTHSPVLSLKAPTGKPGLAVNTKARVPNLNADLVDGLHASALQRRVTGSCAGVTAVRQVTSAGGAVCSSPSVLGFSAQAAGITVPAGVHLMRVTAWGAGGGGGGGGAKDGTSGGGGGQGAYVQTLVTVAPGDQFDVVAGAPGPGGQADNMGGDGGSSTVTRNGTGTPAANAQGGYGGAVGPTGTCTGFAGGGGGVADFPSDPTAVAIELHGGEQGEDSGCTMGQGGGRLYIAAGGRGGDAFAGIPGTPGQPGVVIIEFL